MDSDGSKAQVEVAQVCDIDGLFSLSSLVSELYTTSKYLMEGTEKGNIDLKDPLEENGTGSPNISEQMNTGNPKSSEQRDTDDTLEQRNNWRANIVEHPEENEQNFTGSPTFIRQKSTGSPSFNVKVVSEKSYKVENKMYVRYLMDIDQDSTTEQTNENCLESNWSLPDRKQADTGSPNIPCDEQNLAGTENQNISCDQNQLEDTGSPNKDTGNPNNHCIRKNEAYPKIDKLWLPEYLRPKPKYFKYIIDIKDPEPTHNSSKNDGKNFQYENHTHNNCENRHKCQHCKRTFVHKHALKIHTGTHKTNTETNNACQSKKKLKNQCLLCHKQYERGYDLKRHYISHCTEKPFKCEVCSKDFAQRSALKVHLRIHTGVKPYKCLICNRAFAQKSQLDEHGKVHSQIRNQNCKMCNKSFRYRSSLDRHVQYVHNNMPKKSQKKYSCSVCNRTCMSKHVLQLHIRTHSGEKPFQCHFCERSFASKSSLNVHRRIHTGERFNCPICLKSFAVKAYVRIHLQTHKKII